MMMNALICNYSSQQKKREKIKRLRPTSGRYNEKTTFCILKFIHRRRFIFLFIFYTLNSASKFNNNTFNKNIITCFNKKKIAQKKRKIVKGRLFVCLAV